MTYLRRSSKLLAKSARSRVVAVGAAVAVSLSAPAAQERVNPRGAVIKGFHDRVEAYLQLQKDAAEGLPKLSPTDEPAKVEAFKDALKSRIRLARPDAKPGDIFGDATPLFVEVVRRDAEQRSKTDARAALEEVPAQDPLKVNADYPAKAPLATMPPLLLGELPRLPEGLEYRFMGRDLILRDVKADLVADFIQDGAAPIKKAAQPNQKPPQKP